MAESVNKIVKTVKKLEELTSSMSVMEIEFEDESSAKYISTYSSSLEFIGKEVIVEFREDIFKGKIEKFIAQLTRIAVTSVFSRDTDMKLYAENTGQIFSTISFGDVPESGIMGAQLFCTNVQFESSDKGYWVKLTCLDKDRRSTAIRLFDPIRESANYINRYVKMNIKKRKTFYNADKVELVVGIAPEANPEIRLAKTFILDVLREEKAILDFLEKTRLLEYIEKYNFDEEIEPGYEMVRLAIEIEMINNLRNITKDLNISAMMKYSIISRGYCITNDGTTDKSKSMQNLYVAIGNNFINSKLEMVLIDYATVKNPPEKDILDGIQSIASKIALVNRTYFYDRIK